MVLSGDEGQVLLVYCRNNLQVFALNITLSPSGALQLSTSLDITADALYGLPPVSFVASGPPGGIRSAATGRIVLAMDYVPKKKTGADLGDQQGSTIRSYVMRSDNGGSKWENTGALALAGNFSTSENQVASADDGKTVITTTRTDDFLTLKTARSYRAVAVSTDGGSSFGEFRHTNVPDPTCEGR